MMTAGVGDLSLGLAILLAMGAVLMAIASVRFDSDAMLGVARKLLVAFAAAVSFSVAALAVAMINCDLRLEYVAHYSEKALPIGYKLAALWAGQEGSILLWAWLLAVMCGAVVVARRNYLKGSEGAAVVITLAVVCGFFAALLLFAANPFKPIAVVPADGHGLNPLLQDPAMIAHPPVLFLGYAGFTIPFALLIGALVANRRDNEWLAGARRWIIASWLFLTAGIILGAQWAYVELGWGGYWAWDPVENASLLPWLTGTALMHSVMAQQHRGMFKKWNASLIILSFVLCIFGTYLTRSGVIQSVHAFGESAIGTFFLTFMVIIVLASVSLMLARRRALTAEHELEGLVGREGAFLATNVLLLGMMLVTLVGTIFPIISRGVSGHEVTVNQSFYNKVVGPMGMLLVALMAVGPMLVYGGDAAKRLVRGLIVPAILAVAIVAFAFVRGLHNGWALIATGIASLGVAAVLADFFAAIVHHVRNGEMPIAAIVRIIDGNHRRYGGQLAHLGMLMILVGIVGSSLFTQKESFELKENQTAQLGGFTLRFEKLEMVQQANFMGYEAVVHVTDRNGSASTLRPQIRKYDKAEQNNSEVAIQSSWRGDLYLTLAGFENDIAGIQAIVNPLVGWIWIGGIVMAAGAVLCLLPRLIPIKLPEPVEAVAIPKMAKVNLKSA